MIPARGRVLALLLICLCAPALQAALLSLDDAQFGVGAITLDTSSNLEWLDVSLTSNRSYNDVSSQLGAGGEFEGFRYASQAEVQALWAQAGILDLSNTYVDENYDPIQDLVALLAPNNPAVERTIGIYDAVTLGGFQRTGSIQARDDLMQGKANLIFNGVSQDYISSSTGSYLVRQVVPLPGALVLFTAALAALAGLRRRPLPLSG